MEELICNILIDKVPRLIEARKNIDQLKIAIDEFEEGDFYDESILNGYKEELAYCLRFDLEPTIIDLLTFLNMEVPNQYSLNADGMLLHNGKKIVKLNMDTLFLRQMENQMEIVWEKIFVPLRY